MTPQHVRIEQAWASSEVSWAGDSRQTARQEGETMTLWLDKVSETARRLVALHGRGSVRFVEMFFDGKVAVHCQSPSMKPHIYRGHLNGNTLHLIRHQSRIA